MEWVQGVVTNWIADVGKVAALALLGVIAALIKSRFPRLGTLILYGVGVCALLIVIFGTFRFIDTLPPKVPQVTLDNVEENIRTWLDHFELGTRKTSMAGAIFTFEVTLKNGVPIVVTRLKEFDAYITLQTHITLSPDHKTLLDQLKSEQAEQLIHKLLLEMARSKILAAISRPLQSVSLFRRVPITSSLTEATFIERIEEVNFAFLLVNETIVLELDRLVKENATASVR